MMTLSSPFAGRLGILALALFYTGFTFAAATTPAPALAASSGPYYVVELVEPAKDNRAVASGIAWKCQGTTCVAGKGNSRPIRICRGLFREFGEIASFTAKGEPLAEDKLAKCNSN